jgi:hypothetical protein
MVTSGRSREDDRARGGRADGDVARCGRERRGKRCGGHRARAGAAGSPREPSRRESFLFATSRARSVSTATARDWTFQPRRHTETFFGNSFYDILHMISGQEFAA